MEMMKIKVSIEMDRLVNMCDFVGEKSDGEILWSGKEPLNKDSLTEIKCVDGTFYAVGITRLMEYLCKHVEICPHCEAYIFKNEVVDGLSSDPADSHMAYYCDFCDEEVLFE